LYQLLTHQNLEAYKLSLKSIAAIPTTMLILHKRLMYVRPQS